MVGNIRTSITHPLQVAEIWASNGGRIGVTFCPGKHQLAAATGAWVRDLNIDLEAIRAWGAGVVVTLIEAHELHELKVEDLGAKTQALGMTWLHLPITDVSTPTPDWQRCWTTERQIVHGELDRAGGVLVHCKGGLGRAGTVAALILRERGLSALEAVAAVRAVRPGALETQAQVDFVENYGSRWSPS